MWKTSIDFHDLIHRSVAQEAPKCQINTVHFQITVNKSLAISLKSEAGQT